MWLRCGARGQAGAHVLAACAAFHKPQRHADAGSDVLVFESLCLEVEDLLVAVGPLLGLALAGVSLFVRVVLLSSTKRRPRQVRGRLSELGYGMLRSVVFVGREEAHIGQPVHELGINDFRSVGSLLQASEGRLALLRNLLSRGLYGVCCTGGCLVVSQVSEGYSARCDEGMVLVPSGHASDSVLAIRLHDDVVSHNLFDIPRVLNQVLQGAAGGGASPSCPEASL
jgi:hypothetical protein